MPSGAEEGRYSTPVSSKHFNNGKENTLEKQDEVEPEGTSPPPLAAPLSDDTLDASAEKETANNNYHYQQERSGRTDIDSPFAATPSPIGNRTLSSSEDTVNNDETIDGTFDNDTGVGISRTLNISEVDESVSLLLNNTNSTATNGEASASSRRNSTTNDTTNNTLKSILELSEIDTTFDGAALNRTIGATDASTTSASLSVSAYCAPRDLSEIDITMDRTARDSSSTGNANSIEESNLQAELALDASERMQRMLEEATSGGSSAGGGTDVAGDENSTLAGQAFVGGGASGSGASVMTSGSMASYSIGGNTAATAGTDIAEFLRKQNEAMQKALAGAGVGAGVGGGGGSRDGEKQGGEKNITSPTKTRAVDAAVENARIMAEATAKLTPTGSEGKATDDDQRTSSMEFGSQSHLNLGATGKFTTATDDTTGDVSVTVQSVHVKTRVLEPVAVASTKANSKSVRAKTAASSTSTYQSQYALSPSQRAKESMTVAEKIRQAEAEAMARNGGPRFEKMSAVSETDDDYVPIADYSASAKKKKKEVASVGSFDYNDYSPDNMMGSPDGSAVQRYRIKMRRKRRRRQRRMIRVGLVVLITAAVLFWWHRGGSGKDSANGGEDDVNAFEEDVSRSLVEEDGGLDPTHLVDDATIDDVERLSNDMVGGEETEEVIEPEVVDAPSVGDSSSSEDVVKGDEEDEEDSSSLVSAFAREKIQLVNTDRAPIVKFFKAAKAGISSVEPRAIPFSHFWNKDVRDTAKSKPILAEIEELLDSMFQ